MRTNIINQYIKISKKEINDYIKLIFGNSYSKYVNNVFMQRYIESRYYNFYENMGDETFRKKVVRSLRDVSNELLKRLPVSKKNINELGIFYCFLINLDNIYSKQNIEIVIEKLEKLRYRILRKNDNEFGKQFLNLFKKYKSEKEALINKYENKDFDLQITNYNLKNVYRINLIYNFDFPMIYSKEAIEKVFNTGMIAEDKLFVEYYLVSILVLKEIIKGNLRKNYILEFTESLLTKNKKIKGLLKILENPLIQEKVTFKILYSEFLKNKDEIYNLIKLGHSFSVIIDEEFVPTYENLVKLNIFKYVLLNKELRTYDEIIENKVIIKNLIEI